MNMKPIALSIPAHQGCENFRNVGNKPAFVKPQSNVKKNKESHWKSCCGTQQIVLSTDAVHCSYQSFAHALGLSVEESPHDIFI